MNSLYDHSSIGTDASGNGNHFQDENFAVGNTDEVWSNYLTSSPDFNTNETSVLAFNGDTSNAAYTSNVNTVLTFVPPQSITVNSKLEWWVSTSDNRSEPFIEINDTQLPVQVVTPMKGWLDLDFTGTINKFVFDGNGGANGVFYALKVDGKILVDKNIQDTVLDTPMKNYAVLETGTNGNLVGSGDPTVQGVAGTTYYYETDGVAVTAEGPITGLPNGTHNFGQQPFADVGPQGDEETLYQTWEQYARTALGYALDRIAKLEQQRTSDLATIAELRTRVEEALARIGSIETNEVDDDAVDTVLLTTVADLIERVEALEGA